MSSRTTPPSSDQVEVSVFGRGVGECIVIHLGSGRWMVVDSCKGDGRAVPLEYLEAIGVEFAAIELIVASHWHDDHTRGMCEIVEACPGALVAASDALRGDEFATLLKASREPFMGDSGASEMRKVADVLRTRRANGGSNATFKWCLADRALIVEEGVEVNALSPSDTTVTLAREELGNLIPTASSPKTAFVSQTANQVSVVLTVRVGAVEVLLGSDLEGRAGQTTGWEAILSSRGRRQAKAHVYKVAHHGAPNGDHSEIWTQLIESDAAAVLTPFNAGPKPRPQPEDIARILERTPRLYQAGLRPGKSQGRRKVVERATREAGRDLRPLDGKLGHVRLRAKIDDPSSLSVERFGQTHDHSPANPEPQPSSSNRPA